jgi:hypothetical protein
MTLLTVVRDVCATVGVTAPQSVFSNISVNRTMFEMLSLANEMAQRIAYDNRDWTRLRTTATLTGTEESGAVALPPVNAGLPVITGSAIVGQTLTATTGTWTESVDGAVFRTAFDLPVDYKRMLLTTNVWCSTSSQTPMLFIADPDQWMSRRVDGASDSSSGEWTMYGGKIHIFPAMSVGTTAYFTYLHKNCIALAGGGYGDVFQSDGDRFVLDERLLKLAMIWQWKAQKGSPYAEDLGTYGDAMAVSMGHDQPAPIIIGNRIGGRIAIPTQTLYFPGATP